MKKKISIILSILMIIYIGICSLLYTYQEALLFHPHKIEPSYTFTFPGQFEELYFEVAPSVHLHGLLFKAGASKGLIFYLHGNGGTMRQVGYMGKFYNSLGYDFFAIDYRGYGKSEGTIESEEQLLNDVDIVYTQLKERYQEKHIHLAGFSMGTGFAVHLATKHQPKNLVLLAPYSSIEKIALEQYPFIPKFLLKYPLRTIDKIEEVHCPIQIFHGDQDQVIPYAHSIELKKIVPGIKLCTIPNGTHGNISKHSLYRQTLETFL